MKFIRVLSAGLMALLLCAGTALAASQLNAVHVTPKGNTATVNLQTTGSFAHKEYRPEEHMLLVDMTGVISDPNLVRTVLFRSPVLKSYALSNYTSASGTEVTRLALMLGDNVSADIKDAKEGLRIVLSGAAAAPASDMAGSASAASPSAMAKATPDSGAATPEVKTAKTAKPAEAVKSSATATTASASAPAPKPAQAPKRASTPTVIRAVNVRPEPGWLDVVVDGPSSAHAYLLKNPDRLVVDFKNAVMHPASKRIPVGTEEVHKVRVGRFRSAPPVTRVVADLSAPRPFEVVPSSGQVVVRIKKNEAAAAAPEAATETANAAEAEPAAADAASETETVAAETPAGDAVAPAEEPVAPAEAETAATGTEETASVEPTDAATTASDAAPEAAAAEAPAEASAEDNAAATSGAEAAAKPAPSVPATQEMAAAQPPSMAPPQAGAAAAPVSGTELESPELLTAVDETEEEPHYTGEPISVNLKDVDLKDFFRLIHEISGLNVVLDPAVAGHVTLVLDDVPWDQALDIVLKNNSLDRELHGNVLRIATRETLRKEAVQRRARAEAEALAVNRKTITRSLSYAKATQVMPTIKKFLSKRGEVISDDRTNTLIISDIPSVLPNVDRLITKLDRKTRQVEIEVRVVSAQRSFSRDIGFQLGFNWGNNVTTVGGGGASSGFSGSVPLFANHPAGNFSTALGISNITSSYGVDALLTAAEKHNLAKVLSRPRVVTQNNVQAEVKQGVKIPVTTPGTSNFNAATTYIDAVLRLSVTPQITAENTIFMVVDVENTQPTSSDNPPRLQTQQASTHVLVTDGATVVIGGVIQTNNVIGKSQTPVLGDIPWLGNLFKQQNVQTESNELIFFITPRILEN